MAKISAVINTRNEEQNLRYCLEAVRWCDEIVVVDMESDDRTVAIAREFTDKIYSYQKVLAFDVARKYAVEQATGEWILLIDADEIVPKSLSDKLRAIAEGDTFDAVLVPFMNYLFGAWNRHTGWWPDHHCRFFRKIAMEFSENIHAYQQLREGMKTITLPAEEQYAVHHFAYRDAQQFIEKLNRYTSIEAGSYYSTGKKFSSGKLLRAFAGEFFSRYVRLNGYKDGVRGLFVSYLMGVYRAVSYIKLWEHYQYENTSVQDVYTQRKMELLDHYKR